MRVPWALFLTPSFLLVLLFVLLHVLLPPCYVVADEQEPIHFSADSHTGSRQGEEVVVRYTGHVIIVQGSMKLWADEATYYQAAKEAKLFGHVVIQDSLEDRGNIRLYADQATYDQATEQAKLVGQVVAQDSTATLSASEMTYWRMEKKALGTGEVSFEDRGSQLKADQITYFGEAKRGIAQGHVVLSDSANRVTVSGDYAEYLVEEQSGWVTGAPELIRTEAKGTRITIVTAERMEFYSKQQKSIAKENVHIVRGKLEAFCDEATYFETENRFVLSGKPEATQMTEKDSVAQYKNEMKGDRIEILFRENDVTEIIVSGTAQGISTRSDDMQSPPQVSTVNGKTIRMFFIDEELRDILIEGNATSFYHLPPDEETHDQGMNEASGDSIHFFFEDGEVARVRISGGVIGHYRPTQ